MNEKNFDFPQEQLQQYVTRIESLELEKQNIQEDIKSAFQSAKSSGFDIKALRELIKRRKIKEHLREEQDYLLQIYTNAMEFDKKLIKDEVER